MAAPANGDDEASHGVASFDITRDQVRHGKPDPDLFLAAARRLKVEIINAIVVGDSVWDLLAAHRARVLESVYFPAAMERTSYNALALTAFTRAPRTCSSI